MPIAAPASKVTPLVRLRKLNSSLTRSMSLPLTVSPTASMPRAMPVPRPRKRLFETFAVELPDMSRLRPVRVHSIVLPVTTRATPPPSNQMPRPHDAVPNWPCDVPEIRLSVIVIRPAAIGEIEIARSSTPPAPPAMVDQKIESVTRWPVAPPPVVNDTVGAVVVVSFRKRRPFKVTLSVAVTCAWPRMVVSPVPPDASRPPTATSGLAPRMVTPLLITRSSS